MNSKTTSLSTTPQLKTDDVLGLPPDKQFKALRNKFNNLYKNPKYKALSPQRQEQVKSKMYDNYLSPVLKQHGMVPASKDAWLGKPNIDRQLPLSEGQAHKDTINAIGVSGAESLAKATLFTSHVLQTAALFEHKSPSELRLFAPLLKKEGDLLEQGANKVQGRINQWKSDHYSELLEHRVASKAGQVLGQLPVYMAIGGVFSGVGLSSTVLSKTPMGKFVMDRIVNAADGFLSSKATGDKTGEAVGSGASFAVLGGIGAWARPYLGKLLALGGRKLVQESIAHTAQTMTGVKDTTEILHGKRDFIVQKLDDANKHLLDSLSMQHFQQEYSKLGNSAKEFITKEIGKITDRAEKEVVVHGKEVVEQEIVKDLSKESQSVQKTVNPKFVTKQVVDKAKVKSGIYSTVHAVQNIALPRDLSGAKPRYGYREGLYQTKLSDQDKALYIVATKGSKADPRYIRYLESVFPNKSTEELRNMGEQVKARLKHEAKLRYQSGEMEGDIGNFGQSSVSTERVVPGAANTKSLEFAINAANKYAPKIMMHLQGMQNKLLFAYSIASKEDKRLIVGHLKDEFPGESVAKLNDRVEVLKQHIQEMGLTEHLPPNDERGVFRSTKTAGRATKWQQELKSEVKATGKKLKNYPSARALLRSINRQIEEGEDEE